MQVRNSHNPIKHHASANTYTRTPAAMTCNRQLMSVLKCRRIGAETAAKPCFRHYICIFMQTAPIEHCHGLHETYLAHRHLLVTDPHIEMQSAGMVSIRQHTCRHKAAMASIRQHTCTRCSCDDLHHQAQMFTYIHKKQAIWMVGCQGLPTKTVIQVMLAAPSLLEVVVTTLC